MKILVTRALTLVSSNIPEPDTANGDPGAYDKDTTYNTGNRACVLATHRVYECLEDGVLDVYPPDNISGDDAKWAVVDTTNRWKALDAGLSNEDTSVAYIDTQSVRSGEIIYEVDASSCSAVALFNTQAEKVFFTVKVDGVAVEGPYEHTMAEMTARDPYEWLFTPILMRKNLLRGFGVGFSQTLEIKMQSTGNADVKVGTIFVGTEQFIGTTKNGIEGSIEGYAVDQRDSFGRWYVKKGLTTDNFDIPIYVDADELSRVKNIISGMVGVPAVFLGDNESINDTNDAFAVFGLVDGFKYPVERYKGKNECTLSVKGLT